MCKYWVLIISKTGCTAYAWKQIRHRKADFHSKRNVSFHQRVSPWHNKHSDSEIQSIKYRKLFLLITKNITKKTNLYTLTITQSWDTSYCDLMKPSKCLIHCRRARFSGGGLLGVGGAGLAGPGGAGGFVSLSSCGFTVSCGTSGSFFTSTMENK